MAKLASGEACYFNKKIPIPYAMSRPNKMGGCNGGLLPAGHLGAGGRNGVRLVSTSSGVGRYATPA